MNIIKHPDWTATHPKWRVWHTALLYVAALGLAALGCASVWGGFQIVPDRFSPRHVVGIPFVILGIGLLLRIPLFIWLVSGLCVVFFGLVFSGQIRQFAFFGTPVEPTALLMATGALAYAIVMITGISGGRHSNHTSDGIVANRAEPSK